ncbi:hypothetical protein [Nocardia wallacei]|uniref:hypothetical protein n=1 Tax=Nocardia wallacei TaxID=480035 RepID=UPI0024589ABC|nr:hypothetical protein [Nocardia wallacei]
MFDCGHGRREVPLAGSLRQLEIGDPVTVQVPCDNPHCLSGAHGVVADFRSEHVLVRLAATPIGHADETVVSVGSRQVEYGHTGVDANSAARQRCSPEDYAAAWVRAAAALATDRKIITGAQAALMLAAWQRSRR